MLAIETATAKPRPHATAIGSTAKTYSTPRLSTGTYGCSASIAPETTTTAPTLARSPTIRSIRLMLQRYSAERPVPGTAFGGTRYLPRSPLTVYRDQHGNDQDRDDVRDLDHRVDRRAGGVLVRVADRVARDCGLVGVGALAAVEAVLDQLLRVVPGAAARGHRDGEEEPGDDRPDEQAAEHLHVDDADDDRERDRHDRRQQHAADGRLRDDVDRAAVLRPRRALHDPGVLAELAAHLLHDLAADASNRLHRERREQERHQPADEEAGDHPRVGEREGSREPLALEAGRVRVEQDQRGERRRADRVALRHRLRRVADRV